MYKLSTLRKPFVHFILGVTNQNRSKDLALEKVLNVNC